MKQKYSWIVMYNFPKDDFGWWSYGRYSTRKLAREFKKHGKDTFPEFQWKIEKEPV